METSSRVESDTESKSKHMGLGGELLNVSDPESVLNCDIQTESCELLKKERKKTQAADGLECETLQ